MINKKAQGEIITTVLIILLVLAAVVIVWQVVKATVVSGTGQIETGLDCATLSLTIKSAKNGSTDAIVVHRDIGVGDLRKIKVLVKGSAVGEVSVSGFDELEDFTINTTSLSLTNIFEVGDSISIAPMIGDNNQLCGIADTKPATN